MITTIVYIESSGKTCSVAVAKKEAEKVSVLAEASSAEELNHTALLLPLLKEAFAKTSFQLADTDAVCVSEGPGSYTALRAGFATAKGICTALEVPLLLVSTLKALAAEAKRARPQWTKDFLVILPARRLDVYTARYSNTLEEIDPPSLLTADQDWIDAQLKSSTPLLVGAGAEEVLERYARVAEVEKPTLRATHLVPISAAPLSQQAFSDLASASPLYLKPPFITKPKPRF